MLVLYVIEYINKILNGSMYVVPFIFGNIADRRGGGGGNSNIKVTGVIVVPFRGAEIRCLMPLRVLKSKITTDRG